MVLHCSAVPGLSETRDLSDTIPSNVRHELFGEYIRQDEVSAEGKEIR